MLFLPKSRERYLSALRLHLQNKILRHGSDRTLLCSLKKITLYSLLNHTQQEIPTDIIPYADALLGAAVAELLKKGRYLSTGLSGNGVRLIRQDLFSALLLQLVCCVADTTGCEIEVCLHEREIHIFATGAKPDKTVFALAKRLNALCVRIEPEELTALCVPVQLTDRQPGLTPDEWHYLLDPLSAVYVFLSEVNCFL